LFIIVFISLTKLARQSGISPNIPTFLQALSAFPIAFFVPFVYALSECVHLRGDPGVLIKANNGDVIRYDDTGLILRLSDVVIAELRQRLGTSTLSLDPEVLGDIDAWNLRTQNDWYVFSANLQGGHGPRDFRRPIEGGHIIAVTSGPLFGILSIGGARRAGFNDMPRTFPYHVVSPADDVGSVGLEGMEKATSTNSLEQFKTLTRDALCGEEILKQRQAQGRSLPMIVARTETDDAHNVSMLSQGIAFDNFLTSARNLKTAALHLNKRPRLLAVGLDYTLEDITSTPTEYRDGMLTLMVKITENLEEMGFHKPLFISTFECGTRTDGTAAVLLAQWDLAVIPTDHDLVYSAPGYMFAQTEFDRPTDVARQEMAEMDAYAIEAANSGNQWACPMLLLAEQDGQSIRVTASAMTNLVLDGDDPLRAGPQNGFVLQGTENGAVITDVKIDANAPRDIIITCDKPPEGKNMFVAYAFGNTDSPDDLPANRGALRDEWAANSATERTLHRWALPCLLPVH